MALRDVASPAVTTSAGRMPARFDASRLVLYGFAALLCVLVILPMTWLAIYAFTDRTRSFTLANFQRLFSEAAFIDPLIITFTVAVCSSIACCAVAAPMGWLVARTDLPHHPRAGDRIFRHPAVSRRHCLGAAGGAQQRATQQIIPLPDRRAAGRI